MAESQAVVYSQNSCIQVEDGLKIMSHLNLQEGMKVLDLGCGTGYLASVLAERVGKTGQVVGIDPDKERIAVAESTYGSIGNLTFKVGSAETMEYPEKSFDVVFSNYVLNWIEDKKTVFQNVSRFLKPSGTFGAAITMQILPPVRKFLDLMNGSRSSDLIEKNHLLSTTQIEELASSCGFIMVHKSEKIHDSTNFNSFEKFAEYVYGSSGGLGDTRFMEANKIEEFKQEYRVEDGFGITSAAVYIFKTKN